MNIRTKSYAYPFDLYQNSRRLYIKQEGDVNDQGLPIDIIVETEIPETAFDPAIRMYHSLRQAILDKGLAMPTKRVSQPSTPDVDGFEPFQRVIFEVSLQAIYICFVSKVYTK